MAKLSSTTIFGDLSVSNSVSITEDMSIEGDITDGGNNVIYDKSVKEIPDSALGSISNSTLSNDSITIEGNSVSLGESTNMNHNDLSSISSNDHHSRYSDSEARSAVESSVSRVGGSGLFLDFDNDSDYIELVDGNNNRDQLVTEDVFINQTSDWLGGDHINVNDAHHSRYSDSEARSAVTGTDLPGRLEFQPNSSGGSVTAIRFDSNVNSGSDFAEINYHDSYTDYSDSEAGTLEIKVENDEYNNAGPDAIALDASSGVDIIQKALRVNSGNIFAGGDRVSPDTESSAHHSRYSDSEARSAVESGNLQHVKFANIESVDLLELGIDQSEGLLVDWGQGVSPVLDGYNLSAGDGINLSGMTGASADPTISVDDSDISHDNIGGVSANDHHNKYTDSDAIQAVENNVIEFNGDKITVSSSKPSNPSTNDIWIDTS